jgi:cytochrome c
MEARVSRREFSRNQREQIVERSKRDGNICCERCGLVLGAKPYEIDHIIAEALRPEADKQKKITIAEGQLLGKDCCHRGNDGKTNQDVKLIAKAKRQYNRYNGIKTRASQPIRSQGFPKAAKPERQTSKQTLPPRALYKEIDHDHQ